MTIGQISLVTSIAACLSAIAAFFAIYFHSKQSKESYKPVLVIARTDFKFTASGDIINERLNNRKGADENTPQTLFTVPLINIGLGAAKKVAINWSFPIEDLVLKVNELAQKSLIPANFEYKNGGLSLKTKLGYFEAPFVNNEQVQTVDFILPAPIDRVPYKLVLPLAYTQLVSALVYFSFKSDSPDSFPDIPSLHISLSYFNIGDSKHKNNFVIECHVTSSNSEITGNLDKFWGYIESKNT